MKIVENLHPEKGKNAKSVSEIKIQSLEELRKQFLLEIESSALTTIPTTDEVITDDKKAEKKEDFITSENIENVRFKPIQDEELFIAKPDNIDNAVASPKKKHKSKKWPNVLSIIFSVILGIVLVLTTFLAILLNANDKQIGEYAVRTIDVKQETSIVDKNTLLLIQDAPLGTLHENDMVFYNGVYHNRPYQNVGIVEEIVLEAPSTVTLKNNDEKNSALTVSGDALQGVVVAQVPYLGGYIQFVQQNAGTLLIALAVITVAAIIIVIITTIKLKKK